MPCHNNYTREELKTLIATLGPLPHADVKHIARVCNKAIRASIEDTAEVFFNTCLYSTVVSKEEHWVLFHAPLEDIPLEINNRNPLIQAIAKWRLTVAK